LVMMVGYGAAYSFAAFADDLETAFHTSYASVSAVYGICGFTAFTASAITGPLADRVGPRPLGITGMLMVGLGLITASTAKGMVEIYLCYGLIIGLGIAFSYVPAVAAVQRWFVISRGLASGIAASGIGFGTALVPPATELLSTLGDWRFAFLVSGLAAVFVGVAGALMLSSSPESCGLLPDGLMVSEGDTAAAPQLDGQQTREALRTPRFWLLYGGTLAVSIPVSLPFAHLVRAGQHAGLAHAGSLALLSVIGVSSIAGRFVLGAAADVVGRIETFIGCCLGIAVMILLWAVANTSALFIAFAIGFGVTYGGFVALLPAYTTDRFGRRSAAGIIGILYTGRGLALLSGAPLLSLLVDRMGGYGEPLGLAAVLGALGTAMIGFASTEKCWPRKALEPPEMTPPVHLEQLPPRRRSPAVAAGHQASSFGRR
jgi:MFS family permease